MKDILIVRYLKENKKKKVLEVKDVVKIYGNKSNITRAVDNISFSVNEGEFIGIMGGSLIIEKIFSVPGVGSLYINSINGRDYAMFMLLTVFYTVIGLLASIIVDISYGFIDPRIRMGSKK